LHFPWLSMSHGAFPIHTGRSYRKKSFYGLVYPFVWALGFPVSVKFDTQESCAVGNNIKLRMYSHQSTISPLLDSFMSELTAVKTVHLNWNMTESNDQSSGAIYRDYVRWFPRSIAVWPAVKVKFWRTYHSKPPACHIRMVDHLAHHFHISAIQSIYTPPRTENLITPVSPASYRSSRLLPR
jgi:hypothetical protein